MKSLFTEEGYYTDSANEINRLAAEALKPVFEEYLGYGYSPREISHVVSLAATDLELETMLDRTYPSDAFNSNFKKGDHTQNGKPI